MVEGCLGDDEHAGVDKLYDDGDHVRLLRLHLHGFSLSTDASCVSRVACS
jgi:hypothetical protein